MSVSPIKSVLVSLIALPVFFSATALAKVEVKITQDLPYTFVAHGGEQVRIQRIQDQENRLTGGFTKTSRKCPPFCIQPLNVAPGVATLGELEVIDFMKKELNDGSGLLIDARTSSWHQKGTIPGSINIPFTVFTLPTDDPRLIEALKQTGVIEKSNSGFFAKIWVAIRDFLGIEKREHAKWDFAKAKDLVLWCNGMWCGQSPRAIEGLLDLGYPAEKLKYYRGGMQAWQVLGLTVVESTARAVTVAKGEEAAE